MERSEREGLISCIALEARAIKPRAAWRDILREFEANDLLTYASAISFQTFFALIPLCLLGLGLLGAFGLSDVWEHSVAPDLRGEVSAAAYTLIDGTVVHVLSKQQLFWATGGALIATWEVSGATRATMQVLNRIYGVTEDRSFWRRIFTSIWLSALATALVLGAVAVITLSPLLIGSSVVSVLLRWVIAATMLLLVVGAYIRFAPSVNRPVRWISFGSLLVSFGWVAASAVFFWYVTSLADYNTIFGNLAVLIVALGYIYLSAIVFLTGLQLDSLIRHQIDVVRCEEGPEPARVVVAPSLVDTDVAPEPQLQRQR